jgi:hypothetical protein
MKVRARAVVHDRLFDESEHRSLTVGVTYAVVGIDGKYLRVIDDNGEPILFHAALFDVVDPAIPDDWVVSSCSDGENCLDPPEFAERHFYEDYFDEVDSAVKKFKAYLAKHSLVSIGRPKGRA